MTEETGWLASVVEVDDKASTADDTEAAVSVICDFNRNPNGDPCIDDKVPTLVSSIKSAWPAVDDTTASKLG